jgi:hypothetical protein
MKWEEVGNTFSHHWGTQRSPLQKSYYALCFFHYNLTRMTKDRITPSSFDREFWDLKVVWIIQDYTALKNQPSNIGQFFFSWNWGLNSGLCTCKAGALLLEPHLQSFTHHLPFIHPLFFLKVLSQVPVAPAYNPSYSGGRDQEDQVWSQPRKVVCKTLSQKKTNTKNGWWSASGVGPEFKPQYPHPQKTFLRQELSM